MKIISITFCVIFVILFINFIHCGYIVKRKTLYKIHSDNNNSSATTEKPKKFRKIIGVRNNCPQGQEYVEPLRECFPVYED